MTGEYGRSLGQVFNDVPELDDRVWPGYPEDLFADLAAITGTGVDGSPPSTVSTSSNPPSKSGTTVADAST